MTSRLSYANVMSTLAVFLALAGGIAYALDRNSVKSKHIKNGQVKLADAQKIAFGRGAVFGAIENLSAGSGSANYFPAGNNLSASGRTAVAPAKLRLRDLHVQLDEDVTAGTRRFELGSDITGGGPVQKGLTCEITVGESSCHANGPSRTYSPGEGIRFKARHMAAAGGTHADFSWRAATP